MDHLTLNGTIENNLSDGRATAEELTDYIVVHFYADMRRLALSMLHDVAEAEDVAQQAVIRAVRKINRYRPGSNLKGWLFTITINLAKDLLRRKRTKQRLHNLLTLQFKADINGQNQPNPELMLMRSEQDRALWAAVNQLNDKHKLPVLLRYDFGLSDAEIGDILGVPHGTVRSRLYHAHKQLHAILSAAGVTHR